ncbi:MAG: serine hydrolase domain-containing protein [Actinomycetota bacterium]|nr:serine hydrolase domain-containing protein [Actinomycetota bacterium]
MTAVRASDTVLPIEAWARDGIATRGQIYASVGGVPYVDAAWGCDGLGMAITPDTPFRVYCAGKPALAVALCAAEDAGLLRLTDSLGSHLEGLAPALAEFSLLDVLGHRAGLGGVGAFATALAPPALRRVLALTQTPAPGPHPGKYTEFAGWELLNAVLEVVTGEPVERSVPELLHGRDAWTAPTLDPRAEVAVNVLWRGERRFPLLAERYLSEPFEHNAALGWVASMRTLGRFAEQLLECAAGSAPSRPGANEVKRHVFTGGEPVWDRTLERWCRLGHGVMLDVADHYFGDEWNAGSFGHAGFFGVTWFAADPVSGVVVAVHLVDVVDANQAVMVRRPRVARDVTALAGRDR